VFQLADSDLYNPERSDLLQLVLAIALLALSLQGYAFSLAGIRRQMEAHWNRGKSFLRSGLGGLQTLRLRDNAPIDGPAAEATAGA
jgi:hypothetical protein